MKWRDHLYDVPLIQEIDPAALAAPTDAELEEGEETGQLAGNAMYQDLLGLGRGDLQKVLTVEKEVLARLAGAEDLEAEADTYEDERFECRSPEEELWGLDVGVASAVIAMSALGATPVASCNGGGFGGAHQGSHPYVAAFLPAARAADLVALAKQAGVGARVGDDGLVRVYGRSDLALIRFAEFVLRYLRN